MKLTEPKRFQVRPEIILLLGADPHGGHAIRRALEAVGYPVLTADNGQQADELFRSFDGAIRVVIIDIAFDGKNTMELIAALRKRNPALKVIAASKEVSPRERHDIFISGVIELIGKPVDKEQLLRVVRRIVQR